ncbi:MAG: excinuclease ABC subunit UvrA, partial [Oscillospiraceae bacterium]|nr:excinuclease ABC subunit UvrA [Candidatus Equicaccousia limihippi]
GVPHCPVCGREIQRQTIDQIVDKIAELPIGEKLQILSPIVRGRKGEYQKEFEKFRKQGFVRVRVDGIVYDLSEEINLEKNKKHTIEIVVDRLVMKEDIKQRITDSAEIAAKYSGGLVSVLKEDGTVWEFSQNYACPEHDISLPELEPRLFSFNNPFGACPSCTGLGMLYKVDEDLLVPDKEKSLREGCVKAFGWGGGWLGVKGKNSIAGMYYNALGDMYGFTIDTPYKDIPAQGKDALLYGTGDIIVHCKRPTAWGGGAYNTPFEGIIPNLERRYKETQSEASKREIESVMSERACPECHGKRLNKAALSVTVGGKNIHEVSSLTVSECALYFEKLQFTDAQQIITKPIIKEIKARLEFLQNVGLEYLTFTRSSGTLSGGESQRIRLATQIGSALTGVLYVLDEPSIGLHQRDNERLIGTLKGLRDLDNTVIVVEHDEDTMRSADYIVDIGPGAGVHGGEVVVCGTPQEVANCKKSVTGDYLSGRKTIDVPTARRKPQNGYIEFFGAAQNNLKKIDVKIPLGLFVAVTGVSGSGKSSLVNEIIYKYLSASPMRSKEVYGSFDRCEGLEKLDKVINIDQSPIGRTPRSNPATYTGVFNDIRALFASTKEAKAKGYDQGRFSFNVRGGRCEACEGGGIVQIPMHFLPDVYVPCEVCGGKRYNRETLEIKYKGKNIHDVLEMTVEEGMHFFESIPKIYRKLKTICDVGLGYIKIGQPATTLSGGEAQRVKLATELSKRGTGKTIYILDEPTTGLHTDDVKKLLEVLQRLVDNGNTVLVIEHNLDVIKCADHIIDLGPEGGSGGGKIIATGTPEKIAACKNSYTGKFLLPKLSQTKK